MNRLEVCKLAKGLMKLFLDGTTILKEWGITGLLKGYILGDGVGSSLVG